MFWRSSRERMKEIIKKAPGEEATIQEAELESDRKDFTDDQAEEKMKIGYQKGDFLPLLAGSFAAWLLVILGIMLILAIIFFLFRAILL